MHVNVVCSLNIFNNQFHMFPFNANTCDVYERLSKRICDVTKISVYNVHIFEK